MKKDHSYFMELAIKEAFKGEEMNEVPIGAVLTMNDQVIARSHNQVELLRDSTAHAEILVLTAAFHSLGTKYLPDATLYITVEPCLMCAGALFWSKIGSIVYGASDNKYGFTKFDSAKAPGTSHILHPKTKVISGICESSCAGLIQTFFRNKRKI